MPCCHECLPDQELTMQKRVAVRKCDMRKNNCALDGMVNELSVSMCMGIFVNTKAPVPHWGC